ncbi:hypothetical protein EMPS_01681 [Entomortierella parvispora]|uniref:Uncharacterized protein n=1 Tax=Entomortierella parvispora TaxID=205924 RepID=A0A9P3H3H7_9FUNG|nr:hypothetical protein EMPS_01681 [Entomortierella parvispora]
MRAISLPWIAAILTFTCLVSCRIGLVQSQPDREQEQHLVAAVGVAHDFDLDQVGRNVHAGPGRFYPHEEQQLLAKRASDDDEALGGDSHFKSQNNHHKAHHCKKKYHRHHHHGKHPHKHRKPKKHEHHHHPHHEQQHKHPKSTVTILTLICNKFIVDQIKCIEPCKNPNAAAESFQRLNNGGKDPHKDDRNSTTIERYITMGPRCSPKLPSNCTTVQPREAALDLAPTGDDAEETGDLQELHNTKPKNKHPKKKHLKKSPTGQHPYKDLCVDVGQFCGDKLYGCNFISADLYYCGGNFPDHCQFSKGFLYKCSTIGQRPVLLEACKTRECPILPDTEDDICTFGCECERGTSTCGGGLPDSCKKLIPDFTENAIYVCPSGTPELYTPCIPGTHCVVRESAMSSVHAMTLEPFCKADDCSCKDTDAVCSSEFSVLCPYEKNALYSCMEGKGSIPVKVESCVEGLCVVQSGPDTCPKQTPTTTTTPMATTSQQATPAQSTTPTATIPGTTPAPTPTQTPDQCLCSSNSAICGSAFNPSCGFRKGTLYSCSGGSGTSPVKSEECFCEDGDGSDPIPKETCREGPCIIKPGSDVCTEAPINCNCTTDTPTCGGLFPEVCGFDSLTLYSCDSVGAAPEELEECKFGPCLDLTGADACTEKPLPCNCTKTSAICGGSFAEACGYDPDYLYTCDTGAGTVPVKSTECIHGGCIIQSGPDVCPPPPQLPDPDECVCPGSDDVCGSIFPTACDYDAGSLFACAGEGKKPVLKEECQNGPCRHLETGDICPKPPVNCNCTATTDSCGSTFPDACNYYQETLYSCSAVGVRPEEKEPCTEGDCIQRAGNHLCPSECYCKDTNTICGSEIPDSCAAKVGGSIVENGRYECTDVLTLPTLLNDCGEDATCAPRETDGAFCKRLCTCDFKNQTAYCADKFPDICKLPPNALYKCVNGQPEEVKICLKNDICVCKQNFDPACAYDGKTVYDCGEFGSQPQLREECTTGCYTYKKDGGCTGDPCACWKKGDTCGYTFPASCNLDNHTLYQCERKGAAPKNVGNNCDAMQRCMSFGSEDDACANANTCNSNSKGPVCSQEFQPECIRYTSNVNGTLDAYNLTFQVQIDPDGSLKSCEVGCSDGICQNCNCTAPGLRCGSSFPRACDLEHNLLYLCKGKDVEPEYETNCDNEVCGKGFNRTAPDGSTINGALNDTCLGPCVCRSTNDVCGLAFPASCAYIKSELYKCSGIGQLPVVSKNCTSGCMVTVRDHTCRDCKAMIDKTTGYITSLSATLRNAKGSSSLAGILFGEIEDQLERIKTNLTRFRDDVDPTNYGTIAAYGQLHINATRNILARLKANDDYLGLSSAVQTGLDTFQKAIDDVEQCSSVNVTGCPGMVNTFKRDTTAALALLDGTNLDAESKKSVRDAVATIEGVLTSKDQDKLDEATEDLNRILILAKLDSNLGAPVAGPIDLIIGISTETVNCMFNYSMITEDLSDTCSAYLLRFKGEVSRIAEDFPHLMDGTVLEGASFQSAIEDSLRTLARNLHVRSPTVGNDTRSAKIALNALRNLIRETPALNSAGAAKKVLDEIKNATAAANRVIACTQGTDVCDGLEYILLDIILSIDKEAEKDLMDKTLSAEHKKAAQDVDEAIAKLADAANKITSDPIARECTNVQAAGDKYKALPDVPPAMKTTLDMLKIACRDDSTCNA